MRAVIFDMDGLLIDSEPLWREAEIAVFNTIGITLSDDMCRETMGLRVDEVVKYWQDRIPWNDPASEVVVEQILNAVEHLITTRGTLMAGALDLINEFCSQGTALAIASSSPERLIRVVVEKFSLEQCFTVLHSAEHESCGKPDPAVYQTTMSLLEEHPRDCLAFEDSLAGVKSAKAAGATVVAVPAPEDLHKPEFALADLVLSSLQDFSPDLLHPRADPESQ